jgi:hypothetical protein
MYLLTLVYKDKSTFFVGEFSTMDLLNAWLDKEKSKSYWDDSTQSNVSQKIDPKIPIKDLQAQLTSAFNDYVAQFIDGIGIGVLTIGLIKNGVKAGKFSAWLSKGSADLQSRMAAVTADGQEIDKDFSNNGQPPVTIWDVKSEAGL